MPEFLYDELYDNLHSYLVMSTAPDVQSSRRRKGIYERLFCEECDQRRLGRLDDYAAMVSKGGAEIGVSEIPDCLIVGNLDYGVFKLFQMSVLWRCAVSRRPEFEGTDLGPHAESGNISLSGGVALQAGRTIDIQGGSSLVRLSCQARHGTWRARECR